MKTKIIQIETVLPTVPTVICGLIAEYAIEHPHRWSATIEYNVQAVSESESVLQGLSVTYQKIVSTAGIRDGRLTWSVRADIQRCVFVGLTTADANRFDPFDDTWTITAYGYDVRTYRNDLWTKSVCSLEDDDQPLSSIDFVADASTRRVTADLRLRGGGRSITVDLMQADTDAEFWMIRPCIVLTGRTTATLVSPAD